MRVFGLNRFLEKNGPQANPGDKLVGLRGPIWWAAYTTHMLRVSLVYILIYGSILKIHAYLKNFVRINLNFSHGKKYLGK